MNKTDNLEKCLWKVMAEDKNSTTFQDVTENHPLYKCVVCSGEYGACDKDTRRNQNAKVINILKLW